MKSCKHSCSGFSLFELLITLSVVIALLGLSAPALSDLARAQSTGTTVKQLRKSIALARAHAITSNTLTTLCRSEDGLGCNGKWEQGVLVFTDVDGDRKLDREDTTVSYVTFPKFEGRIYWRAFQNRQYLQMTPSGATRYQNGNFTVCPANEDLHAAEQIIVNRVGRMRFAKDADGDGIKEGSNGKPIRC